MKREGNDVEGTAIVVTLFNVPKKMSLREGGAQRRLSFWNVALKFVHMGTRLSSLGFLSMHYVGKYALVDPTLVRPLKGTLP